MSKRKCSTKKNELSHNFMFFFLIFFLASSKTFGEDPKLEKQESKTALLKNLDSNVNHLRESLNRIRQDLGISKKKFNIIRLFLTIVLFF